MKKLFISVFICLIFHYLPVSAQDTLFLKNDSLMISTGPKIYFKGDTNIIVNKKGEIIEGILLRNNYLWSGRRLLLFREKSLIRFNQKGNVIAGYLAEMAALFTAKQTLNIRGNSYVVFSDEGFLREGELSSDMSFPVNGKPIEFKRARKVYFNDDGQLIGGTLSKREQLLNTEGKTKAYRSGTTVFFNEESEVVFAKEEDYD
jgi:hypothetical protein